MNIFTEISIGILAGLAASILYAAVGLVRALAFKARSQGRATLFNAGLKE